MKNLPKVSDNRSRAGDHDPSGFRPVKIIETEISESIPSISADTALNGQKYDRGLGFIRLHSIPLGTVDFDIPPEGLNAEVYAQRIWLALGGKINEHLQDDGLPSVLSLTPSGLTIREKPRCIQMRDEVLSSAPFISVVIPTRDRAERLEVCISSILDSQYPTSKFEVIVADNIPETTQTFELVDRLQGSKVPIHYVCEQLPGSASARNRGLSLARGEIIAFTDDDVIVDRNWLAELAFGFMVVDDVSCVTGLVVPRELETRSQLWFEEYGGFSRDFDRHVYNMDEYRQRDPLYPYAAGIFGTGNNMAFRKPDLCDIGEFDPSLGNGTPALGGVDSEILLRTILTGHTIVFQPSAVVYHAHRRDYAGLSRQVYSYGVGLTAYLLKTMLSNPRLIPGFLAKVPRGIVFALSPNSEINEKKRSDYPSELSWIERKGMLYGPVAYIRSRRRFQLPIFPRRP